MNITMPPIRIRMSRKLKHRLRWNLIHTALIFFAADFLAAIWPAFEHNWHIISRIGVALAALAATLAEYVVEDDTPKDAPPAAPEQALPDAEADV